MAPGKWVDTTAAHEDTVQGQTEELSILRTLPASGTSSSSRLHPGLGQKGTGSHKQQHALRHPAVQPFPTTPALLKAFKPAYPGEPASSVEDRQRVMDDTWAAFEQRVMSELCNLELQCLDQMHAFQQQHILAQRQRHASMVPTIILSSRGPVTGDRLDTYKLLRQHMEERMNAYTVMLEPAHFQQGAGAAVSEMLWQLARVTGPEEMEALHQWYEDQTLDKPPQGPHSPAQPTPSTAGPSGRDHEAPAHPPITLPHGDQMEAPGAGTSTGTSGAGTSGGGTSGAAGASAEHAVSPAQGTAAAAAAAVPSQGAGAAGAGGASGPGPGESAQSGKAGKGGGLKASLRERKPPQQPPGQRTLQFGQAKAANRACPLMVVVQNAEEVGSCALRDLLGMLLLDYSRFPACLVLGCCKPAHEFLASLPITCLGRMEHKAYDLSHVNDRLATLFRELLCPTTPIVAPSERVLRGLMQQYQQYDGDVTSVLQGLHVAHVLHHTGQPLACLAQAAWGMQPSSASQECVTIDLTQTEPDSDQAQHEDGAVQAVPRNRSAPAHATAAQGDPGCADLASVVEQAVRRLPGRAVAAFARALSTGWGVAAPRGDLSLGDARAAGRGGAAVGGAAERNVEEGGAAERNAEEVPRAEAASDAGAKKRGRPPKQSAPADGQGEAGEKEGEKDGGSAKKRGRPPKHAPAADGEGVEKAGEGEEGEKEGGSARKRGRPPKHAAAADGEGEEGQKDGEKDGAEEDPEGASSKKRGRRAQHAHTAANGGPDEQGVMPQRAVSTAPATSAAAAEEDVEAVVGAVVHASEVYARWRLGVLWASQVAEATGATQERPEYSLPILYLNACSLGFADEGPLSPMSEMLSDLTGSISKYSVHKQDALELEVLKDTLQSVGQQAQKLRPLPDVEQLLKELSTVLQEEAARPRSPSQQQQQQHSPQPPQQQQQEQQQQQSPQPLQQHQQQQQQQQQQQASSSAAPAQPPRRSSLPRSKRARDEELKAATLAQAAQASKPSSSRSPSAAAAAAPPPPPPSTPQSRMAAWCTKALRMLLADNPFHLPGSAVFTFHDAAALEGLGLHAEPRAALHHALVHPSSYLGGHVMDDANPLSTDVEILYQRLLGQDTYSVREWFDDHCEVAQREVKAMGPESEEDSEESDDMEVEEEPPQEQQRGRGRGRGRGRPPGPRKRASSSRAAGPQKRQKAARGSSSARLSLSAGSGEDPQEVEERAFRYAACFSQAAAELEHLGIVRPSRRKKGQNVQRMFYPPEAAPAEFGLDEASVL